MTGPSNDTRSDSGRLPTTVRPRRYDLLIAPDLGASTFAGEVVIALELTEATDTIVLHARELDVALVALTQGGSPVAATLTSEPDAERIVIRADGHLAPGDATLELRFDGEISSGLLGFYRSTYVDEAGVEQVLAATQFEAPHARAAFPCFDEPEFKAVFAVTLVVAPDLLAISNGPEVSRESLPDGNVRIRYGETISMSTYLVAWVVGPLAITDPIDAGGVAVRVAHVPGRGHLTAFALDIGSKAIEFFADYYGIPDPGEKCDLVALTDFSFGAMENLGCVTFRETRLLVDPDAVTLDEMAAAAQTIVHEVAHMWFGDLVTMKWWNGIWLNEAFATFMEHLGVDDQKPEWKTWDDFALGRATALDVDALDSTRTVEYEVVTPEDADGMFDTLTYQKGGSVLRMLERWLGADAFRDGVRLYLDTYKLDNTETTDLWDSLEDATGKPVRQIMDTWIFQAGFPVVRPQGFRLMQERFSYSGEGSGRWVAPVLARVHADGSSETQSLLMSTDTLQFDAPADALVVLNAGGEGFYRVAYPAAWRDALVDGGVLTPLERFGVIDDLWAFVLADQASAEEFVETASKFAGETELVVWRILLAHLRAASRLVSGDALAALRARVATLIAPSMDRLGWEAGPQDNERVRQLRGMMVGTAGAFVGDPEAIGRAREIDDRGGADADVASACVSIVASAGSDDDFERFVARAADPSSPQEQLRYLYALGDFPDEALVLQAVEHALSDSVRSQNGPFVFQRALRNREHGPAAWAFLRDHWDQTRDRFSASLIPRVLEGATWLVDDAVADDVLTFVAENAVNTGGKTVTQHMERLRVHRATTKRERQRFSDYLVRR
ncbi:MAG TPA: M1 family metallopeptidase [Acidimicrobiia bacterium]|nr:M1 family metallopeptidase [Acidimicrobiia bacterium]